MEYSETTEINLGSHYKFYIDKKLGSGAFGDIYYGNYIKNNLFSQGINTKTNQDIAVKVVNIIIN